MAAALLCRSSHRDATAPTSRDKEIGFRVVLSVDAVQETLNRNPASARVAGGGRRGSATRGPRLAVAPFHAFASKNFSASLGQVAGLAGRVHQYHRHEVRVDPSR